MKGTSDIHVTRYSFFHQLGLRTLRFTEHAPKAAHEPSGHGPCGCTRDVDHRPAGSPDDVRTQIRHVERRGHRTFELELGPGETRGFWIRWDWPASLPRSEGDKAHAYFWLTPGRLQIEVTGQAMPEASVLEHTLLGRLFYDRDADVSTLFNGHSPSRILHRHSLDGKLWMHDCRFGHEAIAVIEDEAEIGGWRAFRRDLEEAFDTVARHAPFHAGVEDARSALLAQPMDAARRATDWAEKVLDNLPETAMFQAARKIHGELGAPSGLWGG
jgi:hypothetical protein